MRLPRTTSRELIILATKFYLKYFFIFCTCRSQLLWLSLSRRGKRPSPFLDLMNCFHFHTYFSNRYCLRNSTFPWGFDTTSWPVVIEINSTVKSSSSWLFIIHKKQPSCYTDTLYICSDTVLTSCRETFFPGLIWCFGVLLEPELGLGMDFITVGPDCGQRLNSSILYVRANTHLCNGTWYNRVVPDWHCICNS